MPLFLVIILFAIWSTVFPIGKWTLEFAPPIFLTAFRMIFGGVLLSSIFLFRRKDIFNFTGKQLFSLILLAFFSIYLCNICEYWALDRLPASKVCFLYSLSPFFTALLSYLHFKEKMTWKKWVGLSIGFLGILPVLNINFTHLVQPIAWPDLAAIGAAFFGVYGWIILRVMVKNHSIAPEAVNGVTMLLGGFMAFGHSLLVENWNPVPFDQTNLLSLFGGVLAMTLISNIFCYNLYGYMLKRYTATLLSFAGLLSPIFASLSSWLILGETPSPLILASTGVILLGLWLVYQEELSQGYIKKEKTISQAAN